MSRHNPKQGECSTQGAAAAPGLRWEFGNSALSATHSIVQTPFTWALHREQIQHLWMCPTQPGGSREALKSPRQSWICSLALSRLREGGPCPGLGTLHRGRGCTARPWRGSTGPAFAQNPHPARGTRPSCQSQKMRLCWAPYSPSAAEGRSPNIPTASTWLTQHTGGAFPGAEDKPRNNCENKYFKTWLSFFTSTKRNS